ncbi:hypothetical protein Tco_0968891 [Tanacetum coccineum]
MTGSGPELLRKEQLYLIISSYGDIEWFPFIERVSLVVGSAQSTNNTQKKCEISLLLMLQGSYGALFCHRNRGDPTPTQTSPTTPISRISSLYVLLRSVRLCLSTNAILDLRSYPEQSFVKIMPTPS